MDFGQENELFSSLTDEMTEFCSLGIRRGLARLSRLAALLGSPERSCPAIHVLGTNGKGSTTALLGSICQASGMSVATYTSPHLISLRERVSVGGRFLEYPLWERAWLTVKEAIRGDAALTAEPPTFFEALTALAFLMIRDSGADIAIMEAGMGGRYDATMLSRAVATVITPIGMDHMEYLGLTLQAIAGEKFAAIRPGKDVFFAAEEGTLRDLFLRTSSAKRALPHCFDELSAPNNIRLSLEGTSFTRRAADGREDEFYTPLVGLHQAANAANAVSVMEVLSSRLPLLAHITAQDIKRGLAEARWPGRIEVLKRAGGITILDGAHNEHGFTALAASIDELVRNGSMSPVGAVVFGVMADKDVGPLLNLLQRMNCPVFSTQAPIKRALAAAELERLVVASGMESGGAYEDAMEALQRAEGVAPVTLCCGSLYLVGSVKKGLGHES